MSNPIDLSIIIPAYREGERVAGTLEELAEFLKTRSYGRVEVLVVSPEDPEKTAAAAQSKEHLFEDFKVIRTGTAVGKGRDVRVGIYEANGLIRLFMDADLATPLHHIDDVVRLIQNGADVAIAVRNLFTIHKGFLRKVITKTANLVVQILLLPGIKDTQCGFKAFKAEAATEIFGRQTLLRWSFDMEVLKIARLLGYKIGYIEAPDWKDPKAEGSGLSGESPLKVALTEIQDPIKVLINVLGGKYRKKSFVYEPPQA